MGAQSAILVDILRTPAMGRKPTTGNSARDRSTACINVVAALVSGKRHRELASPAQTFA